MRSCAALGPRNPPIRDVLMLNTPDCLLQVSLRYLEFASCGECGIRNAYTAQTGNSSSSTFTDYRNGCSPYHARFLSVSQIDLSLHPIFNIIHLGSPIPNPKQSAMGLWNILTIVSFQTTQTHAGGEAPNTIYVAWFWPSIGMQRLTTYPPRSPH